MECVICSTPSDYLIDTYVSEETKFPLILSHAANIALLSLIINSCESYHLRFNFEFYQPHTIYHFFGRTEKISNRNFD